VPAKARGLGRGLDALLPKTGLQQVPVDALHVSPLQPRKRIDDEGLAELSASIAEKGVLQPLLVRPSAAGFEIVAGERRFRAAMRAGLSTVPVVIKALDDRETLEVAIIENLQREDLSPVEEARAYAQLQEFGLKQDGIAKAVGKSRSAVANTLRLLKLPDEVIDALDRGAITAGHARAILAQPDVDRSWAFGQIVSRDLLSRTAAGPEPPTGVQSGDSRGESWKDRTPLLLPR
jgi:ParB family chromosome partitioning protein